MKIHNEITISGVVQGVGFRFSARNAARIYGISGYVMNLPDGSVFIEAEGPEFNINQFIKWCYEGPPSARIENVSIHESKLKDFKTFEIKL